MNAVEEAAGVRDGQAARAVLERHADPRVVRALACRAEELRFDDSAAALEVATVALEGLAALPKGQRRPRLMTLTWSVYASCCRARLRFDEADFALNRAAASVPASDARAHAGVARRFAVLRADQRKEKEARKLIAAVLVYWRQVGGRGLGEQLCASGGILIRFRDFRQAAMDLEEAVTLLAPNGDRFHTAALFNLAVCRLELSSDRAGLDAAKRLTAEAGRLIKPGTLQEIRWHWQCGRLFQRYGRLDDSLDELTAAHGQIDRLSDAYDQALLLLDLTDLHLERGEAEQARHVALSSFGVMAALHNEPEALRAIRRLHQTAQALSLDRAAVRSVRRVVVAARL